MPLTPQERRFLESRQADKAEMFRLEEDEKRREEMRIEMQNRQYELEQEERDRREQEERRERDSRW